MKQQIDYYFFSPVMELAKSMIPSQYLIFLSPNHVGTVHIPAAVLLAVFKALAARS